MIRFWDWNLFGPPQRSDMHVFGEDSCGRKVRVNADRRSGRAAAARPAPLASS